MPPANSENRTSSTARAWPPVLIIVLVAASLVLSTSMGIRQSLGLFLDPLVQGAGVSVALFGLAIAVQNLTWGIAQPIAGAVADRYGGRVVVVAGAALFAAGLWLMSIGTAAGLFLGGGLLIGAAVAATSHGVLVGILSRLAGPAVRAAAVSILAAAGSLGTFVLAPLSQGLLDRVAWDIVLLILAAIAAAMAFLAFLFRTNGAADCETPPRGSPGKDASGKADALGAIRQALRHPGYIAMTAAFFACGFQLIFIATHLPNFIAYCGLPPSVSAHAIAMIGIFNAVGTLAAGYLGERYGHKLVLAMIYLLRTVAIAAYAFLPVSLETTLLFGASMGLLWLSVIPPVSALINSLFGATNFGALFGVMFLSHQIGAFLGAWLGGLSFEMSGSYTIAWIAMLWVGVIAFVIQLSMKDRQALQPA